MKGVQWECPDCGRRYKAKEQWADWNYVYERCMWVPMRLYNWFYARGYCGCYETFSDGTIRHTCESRSDL